MNEQISKLQEEAKKNETLKNALVAAGSDLDKVVAAANAHGISVTKADLESAIASAKAKGALGKDDLDKAAGGIDSIYGPGQVTNTTVVGIV